jgi:hypothetical protein
LRPVWIVAATGLVGASIAGDIDSTGGETTGDIDSTGGETTGGIDSTGEETGGVIASTTIRASAGGKFITARIVAAGN